MTSPITSYKRRDVIAAPFLALRRKTDREIAGSFVNESQVHGHRLRDRARFAAPRRQERTGLVIVGGGIAGLCAAWRLLKKNFRDFVLLEMEPQAGGNSRFGQNEVSRYPWAAHYVPPPPKAATLAGELFEELGVLKDGAYDERHLCHSPQERLFLHGKWQEGLEPEIAATPRDREQFGSFFEQIGEFRATGEFTIPAVSPGPKTASLDRESMTGWLARNHFDSPYLNWYVDYACRDDYGTSASAASAWAGVHYFAARPPNDAGPLTWAEGNGWIVDRLLARVRPHVRTSAAVHAVMKRGARVTVVTEQTLWSADSVIFAAPTFLASYIVEGAPAAAGFSYSPWITANLMLDRLPRERNSEPAWDNVIYKSRSLGYVVATHQSLQTHQERSVWTWYWPLCEKDPGEERRRLLSSDWSWWRDLILADLSQPHPDIRECVSRIDVMRLGHAMVRPAPGFITSRERASWSRPRGPVFYANSDLSGYSIFEEAQYRGVRAADAALEFIDP